MEISQSSEWVGPKDGWQLRRGRSRSSDCAWFQQLKIVSSAIPQCFNVASREAGYHSQNQAFWSITKQACSLTWLDNVQTFSEQFCENEKIMILESQILIFDISHLTVPPTWSQRETMVCGGWSYCRLVVIRQIGLSTSKWSGAMTSEPISMFVVTFWH